MITSPDNEKLKRIRKLRSHRERERTGLFVVEGEDLVAAAAAARREGLSYSQLIHGLDEAGVEVNRKMLADIAVRDPEAFRRFAELAREGAAT